MTVFTQKNPRMHYIKEASSKLNSRTNDWNKAKRIIAITFSYTPDGNVTYGASIFKRTEPKEGFVKKQLRKTALERFYKAPVTFKINVPDGQNIKFEDVVNNIRRTMFKEGVSSDLDEANKYVKIYK